jgi:hypothetical protein
MKQVTSLFFLLIVNVLIHQQAFAADVATLKVSLREPIGIAWRDELIKYPLSFKAGLWTGPAVLSVTDDKGQELTSQITDLQRHADQSIASLVLWLKVDLDADQARTFTVRPGVQGQAPTATTGSLVAKADAQQIELLTDAPKAVGIRLLAGKREFTPAIAASQAPGPIRSLLLPSGKSVGKGTIQAPFAIKSYEATLDHAGPLFAQATVRYTMEQGYWTMKVRVIRGCPMVLIEEEFDTGDSGQTWENIDRFYQLNLSSASNPGGSGAFTPTQAFFTGRTDKDDYRDLLREQVPATIRDGGTLQKSTGMQISGYTIKPDASRTDFFLMPWPTWSPRVGGFYRFVEPGGDAIGIATVRLEGWRNPLALRITNTPQGPMLNLPMQVYRQGWTTEGFGNPSPNYTGRTLGVPPTTGWRSYGIMLTTAGDETKDLLGSLTGTAFKLGTHPLDQIKDWIVDWPDPMAQAKWTDVPTPAGENLIKTMRDWITLRRETGNFGVFSMWTYYSLTRKARYDAARAIIDDPAQLSASQRKTLRQLLAYQAYVMNSVEVFPWGIGSHLGNPNMSIMCMDARVKASLLIKDHPFYRDVWGKETNEFCKLYIDRYTRETGAPFENCHYTLCVTIWELAQVNQSMREAGLGDFFDTPRFKAFSRFMLDWLAPPDPRFLNHRLITSFGNGSSYMSMPLNTGQYLVEYYKERDPLLASQIQWFTNQTQPEKNKLKIVTDAVPALTSVHHKDYGVMFRHGFGTPFETYFHLLAGDCEGHYEWETEQMAYTLYAKGQPINLHFGNGYHPMFSRPWMRNRVSIDHMREINERHDPKILKSDLSPEADYVHASKSFDRIQPLVTEYPILDKPKGLFNKDIEPPNTPIQTIPLVTWHRQIMFLKDADPAGPNYFVLRETFTGQPTRPTDLSFWFLANTMTRAGDTYSFDGQCKVDMDVFVHTPASGEPQTDSYGHTQHPYRRLVGFDPAFHPNGVLAENQLLLRLKQPAKEGYLVVLYPRLKGIDAPAQYERLSPSAVKVTTPLSTDYVFMDSSPMTFEDAKLKFAGTAAAVRFFGDGSVVVVNQQGPIKLTIAGKTIAGSEGFTLTLKDGKVVSKQLRDGAKLAVD